MSTDLINCAILDQLFQGFSLKKNCDIVGENTLRISTPFFNSDGSSLDLFLEQGVPLDRPDRPLFTGYILSDLGETAARLYSLRIKLATRKRRQMVADICEYLGVEFRKGEFQIRLEPADLPHLPDAMIRLAQACLRVADFAFSQRFPLPGDFCEDVEEFIEQLGLRYDPHAPLLGKHGNKEVEVDFRVYGPQKQSLVETISAKNPDYAHQLLNETFSRWFSLSDYRKNSQFLTVLQDEQFAYRPDDIERLVAVSDGVYQFPSERNQFKGALLGEPKAA